MPITMLNAGESKEIQMIKGKDDTRCFLHNLGFTKGETVSIVSKTDGNLIVNIKSSRVAISKSMANKIMV